MFHFVRKFRESAASFVVAEMMIREVLVIHCRNFFFESLKIDNKDNILLESRERDENEISFLSHTHSTLQK